MKTLLFHLLSQENSALSPLTITCLMAIILVFAMFFLASAIRIIPEYARMAIFRLGRFINVVGPGIIFLLPFVDRGIQVDLREKKETINTKVSTQDNARINVQLSLGYRVIEPEKSILNIPDLTNAVRDAARNRLKSTVGNLTYGDVTQDRRAVETELHQRLDEAMKSWGCEVTSVEILEIQRS